ncbi:MAG: potassium channel family protein, partial [Patescibacteria group bacterium]
MKSRVMLLVVVAAVSLGVSTGLFWMFEHGCNPNVKNMFDAIWWWVVTSATVGYGDIVPVTWQGRVVAIGSILTGFFIYASFVAIIAEAAHEYLERRTRGTAQVTSK